MKKLLLYLLTFSMLLSSSVFVNPVATALVQTNKTNAELEALGYVGISSEAELRDATKVYSGTGGWNASAAAGHEADNMTKY